MANSYGKRSKKLNIAKKLPPSFHKKNNENFDIKKSEVIEWLINQPQILEFVWDNIKQSGDIVFNQKTGKWQGIDYE